MGEGPGSSRMATPVLRARVTSGQKSPSAPERWQSGLLYLTRNQACPQGYRGFESHPLRQLKSRWARPGGSTNRTSCGTPMRPITWPSRGTRDSWPWRSATVEIRLSSTTRMRISRPKRRLVNSSQGQRGVGAKMLPDVAKKLLRNSWRLCASANWRWLVRTDSHDPIRTMHARAVFPATRNANQDH